MIKSISLINCQSWDNSTIELAEDRVNVLQADNNVGKSVLFKMLKITADPKCYPPVKRKELIRWGTSGAIILFNFTDGTQGYTQVLPNGVSYYYNGNMYALPPQEYLEKIGLLTSNGMIANLIDAKQDLLLVDPTLSANYELMQLLVHNDNLENIRENTEANIKKYNIKSDTLTMVSRVLQNQLSQYEYTDIEKREHGYEISKVCYEVVYDHLVPAWKQIESLNSAIEKKDFNTLSDLYNTLCTISDIDYERLDIKDFDYSLLELLRVTEIVSSLDINKTEVKQFDKKKLSLYDALLAINDIEFAELKVRKHVDLKDIYTTLEIISSLPFNKVNISFEIKEKIEELKDNLKEQNAVYNCPIYGDVMYDGESCQPIKDN